MTIKKKLDSIRLALKLFSHTPFLSAVFLTGSLTDLKVKASDDIDFLIISCPHRLWLLRPILIFIVLILGKKRVSHQSDQADKICMNIFIDGSDLRIPPSKQTSFGASQLKKAIPLILSPKIKSKFYQKNQWINKFKHPKISSKSPVIINPIILKKTCFISKLLDKLNDIFFQVQYNYMKRKITNEIITLNQAFFHPRSIIS